ncbi:MAG: DUF1365 domain-containing protein [Pelagibacteraceae bacterium]|nr:DUF1365 domain-containing protein [Pelagibacteraceae bacterium]MBT3901410.1 DUF1365 domain-containing protein [Pelagibacteraceae bacterium]
MNTKLLISSIVHKRYGEIEHFFKYKVPSIFLDLDEIEILKAKSKIFSINSFNIFSFNEKDHGYRDERSVKEYISQSLRKYKINYNKLKIKILCFPRLFGYVFNPLSILYCYDEKKLIAIFYEVKNTSNEQHTYIFANAENTTKKSLKHECDKDFYVSPFIGMRGKYKFTNRLTNDQINIIIDLYNENNQKILMASQSGKFIEFKGFKLLKYNLLNPLLGLKVMVAILFEALRIVLKGGKYNARKKKIKDTMSFEGSF